MTERNSKIIPFNFEHHTTIFDTWFIFQYGEYIWHFVYLIQFCSSLCGDIFRKYCEINSYNKELIVNYIWGSEESGSIDCSFQHRVVQQKNATSASPRTVCRNAKINFYQVGAAFVNDIVSWKQLSKYLCQAKTNKNHPICLVPVRYN